MLKYYLLIAVFFVLFVRCARSDIPVLEVVKGTQTQQGIIKLAWKSSDKQLYELEEASDQRFYEPKIRYSGPDQGTFLSGLNDGTYYYRLRNQHGDYSNVVELEVRHHPIQLAISLLMLGALVFIITTVLVVRNYLNLNSLN